MSTKLLPASVIDVIKKNRVLYRFARAVRFSIGATLGSRNLPGIHGPVHWNDFMLRSSKLEHIEGYRQAGINFVGYLEEILGKVDKTWDDVEACFDVGCGYGRLTRAVLQKVAPEKTSVCDVNDSSASFCSKAFGVKKVGVNGSPEFPSEPDKFDLVWLYSVFTHLSDDMIAGMIADYEKIIKPGGILVFTTHGWTSVNDFIDMYDQPWPQKAEQIKAAMKEHGSFYERYSHYFDDIGMAWHTPERIEEIVQGNSKLFERIDVREPGLPGGHQDYYCYKKR